MTSVTKYLTILLLIIFLLSGCGKPKEKVLEPGVYAQMETTKGTIVIELDYKKVPMLVANFVGLAEGIFQDDLAEGTGFYDDTTFDDVTKDVIVKGGMPPAKSRRLPGFYLPKDIHPELMHDRAGAISMLNKDGKISAYQFSIALKPLSWLDHKQPVFGYVIDGFNVLNKISMGDSIKKVTINRIGENAERFIITKENFNMLRQDVERSLAQSAQILEEDTIGTLKETYPDLIQTPEGIWFTILKQGTGTPPTVGTKVVVKYTGTLIDGTVFMETAKKNGGVETLRIGEAFRGLDGALQTMRKGERRIIALPPALGFGDAGLKPLIPPKAFLIFDIELIDF